MGTKLNLGNISLALIAILLVALPATAATTFNVTGDNVSIEPSDRSFAYSLKVTGPGDYLDEVDFAAGENILWNAGGLLDGPYHFEVTAAAPTRERGGDQPAVRVPETATTALSLVGGAFVDPRQPEQLRTKDIVHLDDVIIQFSLCVGNDCVNGESFGFDTLRLKENNVRVHFDDTSTSASFPRNDWRIIINDSSNGGSNYWAIEDSTAGRQVFRVDAGAPANSLRVDSGGDVGIGTATPVVDLHVVSGNTPTLRLEQNGSSGFTAQTWDVAGNEANFFVRDATNGSRLPFRIEPNTPQDALFLEDTGEIGVGTNAPETELHVRRASAAANIKVEGTAAGILVESTNAAAGSQNAQIAVSTDGLLRLRSIDDTSLPGINLDLDTGAVGIGTTTPNAGAALDVNGAIFQRGSSLHADYVFSESYELESIEHHAAFMWKNKHLPAVPGRMVDSEGREILEIGAHRRGMLEELEKAHVYITQLNSAVKAKDARISELSERLERLEALLLEQN